MLLILRSTKILKQSGSCMSSNSTCFRSPGDCITRQIFNSQQQRLYSLRTIHQEPPTLRYATAPRPESLKWKKPSPRKWLRRLAWLSATGATILLLDYQFNASSLVRSSRAIRDLSLIALDFKLNFREGRDIEKLHERVANRMYYLIVNNAGMYIKIGQALAAQSAVMPPIYQKRLSLLYDAAPQDPWTATKKLLKEEYNGKDPEEVFDYIETKATASASIAQVHKARLKTGEWVAVKVQHPAIRKQMRYDLAAFRAMIWIYDRFIFNIPFYFAVDYICNRVRSEADFFNEAKNTHAMRKCLENEPSLCGHAYIPKVFDEYTTSRVLVTEYIDGVSLGDRQSLKKLKYNFTEIMNIVVNLFSAQIFKWGIVHCDPHPGNMIIRRVNGRTQVVLIDHGLYIYESSSFRKQYCLLWRSLFTFDTTTLKSIATQWGIGSPDIFASFTMMRPYGNDMEKAVRPELDSDMSDFERQRKMRETFRHFIEDTTKVPLELIFLGRVMTIVQGCNQLMGSPVNRINILASWASIGLHDRSSSRWKLFKFRDVWTTFKFRIALIISELVFRIYRIYQVLTGSGGYEVRLERNLRAVALEGMGVELTEEMFRVD